MIRGRRRWVRPVHIERRWDDFQQQHTLRVHLRWPTYREPLYGPKGEPLERGAALFGVTRAGDESDDELRARTAAVADDLRPFTVADWLDLIDQHRPLHLTTEAVLRDLLRHIEERAAW